MTNKITAFFRVAKSTNKRCVSGESQTSSILGGGTGGGGRSTTIAVSVPQNEGDCVTKDAGMLLPVDTAAAAASIINDGRIHGLANNNDSTTNDLTTTAKRAKLSNDCVTETPQLLMYLNDDDIDSSLRTNDDIAGPSSITTPTNNTGTWKESLQKHLDSTKFHTLSKFVAMERERYTIYPPNQQVWTALNTCPLSSVKVVIVGQDPYHGVNQAHGLSFSVLPGCPIPPSLKNIYKELLDDPNISNFTTLPNHGHLIRWVQQGVLLLNAVMTVRDKEPNSHQKKGWESVTDEIIRIVMKHHCCGQSSSPIPSPIPNVESADAASTTYPPPSGQRTVTNGRGCVFLLWGKPATTKAMNVIESVVVEKRKQPAMTATTTTMKKTHAIICTSHPSPLGARKTATPFLGSCCFSRCNDELIAMGHDPIDWNV